jgi:thiosulfate/3-mercaptopyruvate sulfurtransferase
MPDMTSTGVAANVVITADELRGQLRSARPVVILEVRREAAAGDQPFADHLPGAQLVTLTTELVGPRSAGSGNFPLPTGEQLQDAVRRWGIDEDSLVIVYSREAPALAARAWWTLRWAGVRDVRYLDGGHAAWVAAGGELSSDAPGFRAGSFTVTLGSLPVLDTDGAAALARSGVLLDARDQASYVGEPDGGHIPGAASLPGPANVDADGRLKSEEELRGAYAAAGVSEEAEVGAYCGGGTSATLDVLALARLGVTAALYPGSFSAWSSDPARPVTKGNEPG